MDKNMIMLPGTAAMLPYLTHGKSRAINAENRTGEKGKGGMAASGLGKSRKGSPCLNDIQPGETVVLGDIDGPGIIHHIWIQRIIKRQKEIASFLGTWFSECIGMARKIHP